MKIIRHPLFMRPSPESELEQAIDRELKSLPDVPAPATLIPRVRLAIEMRQRQPWWRKSISYWPAPARWLFIMGTTGLAGFLVYISLGFPAEGTVTGLTGGMGEIGAQVEVTRSIASTLGGAVVALARAAGPWLGWVGAGVAAACYLTTLGLGTLFYRLAAQRI